VTRKGLNEFKNQVMESKGYGLNSTPGENVKYEIARELGIPLNKEDNGSGGPIGGNMVREMKSWHKNSWQENDS